MKISNVILSNFSSTISVTRFDAGTDFYLIKREALTSMQGESTRMHWRSNVSMAEILLAEYLRSIRKQGKRRTKIVGCEQLYASFYCLHSFV